MNKLKYQNEVWETDQCDQHWDSEEYQKMNRVIRGKYILSHVDEI